MRSRQAATTSLFEITLFTLMVAAIATVAFVVMGEYGLLASCFLGIGIGLLAGTVLSILLRRPRPKPEDGPIGRAPGASEGRDGSVVPARGGAEAGPASTAASRIEGGDAGGVGRPATAQARSPLDPAELPVAGAGGPLNPVRAAGAEGEAPAKTGDAPAKDDRREASRYREPVVRPTGQDDADAPAQEDVVPAVAGPEPERPPRLEGPREGGPDDLTRIRGIGPALERMLNEHGIYHFAQIAAWTPAEVAWADENLEDFKGRVTRDNWVGQARSLSEG